MRVVLPKTQEELLRWLVKNKTWLIEQGQSVYFSPMRTSAQNDEAFTGFVVAVCQDYFLMTEDGTLNSKSCTFPLPVQGFFVFDRWPRDEDKEEKEEEG